MFSGRMVLRARVSPFVVVWVVAAYAFAQSSTAAAATAAPGWTITSIAEPANFSITDNAACEEDPTAVPVFGTTPCDSYRVIAKNVGSAPSTEPIVISDDVPSGLEAVYALLEEEQGGASPSRTECTLAPVRCEYGAPVAPGGELIITINVKVLPLPPPVAVNGASMEGGGLAHPLSTSEPTSEPNTIDGPAPAFDINGFDFRARGLDGAPDDQAGGHPYALTTSFHIPSFSRFNSSEAKYQYVAAQDIKDLVVDLPPGFVGDPQATPRCPLTAINENINRTAATNCPAASRIGTVTFEGFGQFHGSNVVFGATSSIFNMVPEAGYPAEFGLSYLGRAVLMYASVLPSASGYRLRVEVPGLIALPIQGISLTFFGDPAHEDGGATPSEAFLTNPTDCAGGPLKAKIEANSWEEPTRWAAHDAAVYPQLTGCEMLQFHPSIEFAPESTQVDSPSGYDFALNVPQAPAELAIPATPEVKDAMVTLPEGISVSPSAADGLVGCKERGPEGIELGDKDTLEGEGGHTVQEGEEAGPGGLPRAARGHCPAGSELGTVEVETPLLPPHTLTGHLYLAQPKCGGEGERGCEEADAMNGNLYGLFLEAEGDGVVIKLKGKVSANPSTGQLTVHFEQNPQLPFSELRLHLNGGARAPLANPQICGQATTTSDLSPWSAPETPDATASSSFDVTGCAASTPFGPSFTAGTVTPSAGGFSPFTLTFSRQDGEQNLAGITVQTPPGLLGKIATVPLCGEPQARQGSCPAASQIGVTNVAAGAGSHPLWLSGAVYLTGAYKGAPFGLSIVVPEKAGPFNLGNEVVRAAINVDSHTSALTVVSDPLPQHKDGVPFRLKTVNVTIDRPNFIFNPTNCAQQAITGTIAGVLPNGSPGASVAVSSPFAVAGCKNLPFNPKFTVLALAKTSKANGVYLHVKVVSGAGQANIAKVKVDLPVQLPSRLSTLQKACVAAVFEANPASCPAASVVGTGTAVTPVLKSVLTGPAYLVSHGGAKFPDLEIVLQGEGITLDLVGNTDIKKGITSSTFKSVPDAPISTFDLVLSVGPHSVLAAYLPVKAKGSMCGQSLAMPTAITGQNGAVIKQTTKIAVSGCPKHKKVRKQAKKVGAKHMRGAKKKG